MPARIFSSVSSTVFPSGTRGLATTVMTDWTPRWRSWKARMIAVELEQDARFVDFGRQLIGEMGDQVFGQPGVDFLIGEHSFPVRLVADVVAELKALGDEFLSLTFTLLAGLKDDVTIVGGLIG